MPEPTPTFWETTWAKTKTILVWLAHKLLAPGVALLLVIGAVLLFSLGMKDLQIGGLLGKLLGKKAGSKAIDVANSVPKDRVDSQGKLIPQGQADSKGMTQAVVVPIHDPGIFSNPDTVVFTPPGETKPVEVQLPDGVKAKDVEHVVIVKPDHFVVTVKDSSGIPREHIDAILKKYS
jgi:hypothetical protein